MISKKSKCFNEFLCSLLCSLLGIHFYLGTFLKCLGIDTYGITAFVYILCAVFGTIILLRCSKDNLKLVFFFFLFIFFFVSVDLMVNNAGFNIIKSNSVISLFFIFSPVFLRILCGIKMNGFLKWMSIFSRITLVLMSFVFIYIMFYKKMMMPEYMAFAYYSIIPIVFLWSCKRKFFDYLLIIVSSIFVFITGCRGALIVLLAFYFLLFIYPSKQNRVVFVKSIFLFAAVIAVIALRPLLTLISSMLGDYGSRTLTIILSGEGFFSSSSRLSIWSSALDNLSFFGYGPVGYRTIIQEGYVHNIVLELLLSYGMIPGILLFVSIFALLLRNFIRGFKQPNFAIYVICSGAICMFFIKLMISDSFLFSMEFWLFLGLSLVVFRKKRKTFRMGGRSFGYSCC